MPCLPLQQSGYARFRSIGCFGSVTEIAGIQLHSRNRPSLGMTYLFEDYSRTGIHGGSGHPRSRVPFRFRESSNTEVGTHVFIENIGLSSSNQSDKILLSAVQGRGDELSKEIGNALKGVRLWYIKQCTTQSDEIVLRDLLLPFMDPLIVRNKVRTYVPTLLRRVSIVLSSFAIVGLFSGHSCICTGKILQGYLRRGSRWILLTSTTKRGA